MAKLSNVVHRRMKGTTTFAQTTRTFPDENPDAVSDAVSTAFPDQPGAICRGDFAPWQGGRRRPCRGHDRARPPPGYNSEAGKVNIVEPGAPRYNLKSPPGH